MVEEKVVAEVFPIRQVFLIPKSKTARLEAACCGGTEITVVVEFEDNYIAKGIAELVAKEDADIRKEIARAVNTIMETAKEFRELLDTAKNMLDIEIRTAKNANGLNSIKVPVEDYVIMLKNKVAKEAPEDANLVAENDKVEGVGYVRFISYNTKKDDVKVSIATNNIVTESGFEKYILQF